MKNKKTLSYIQVLVLTFAALLGVISSFGILEKWIAPTSAILCLLAIIIIDLILDRAITLNNIDYSLSELLQQKNKLLWSNTDLEKISPFSEFIEGSDEVLIIGHSLLSQFVSRRNIFLNTAQSGVKIRVAILDPRATSLNGISTLYGHDTLWLHNEILSTLNLIIDINKQLSDRKKIRIRLLDTVPCVNTEISFRKTDSILRAGIYLYLRDHSERQFIVLNEEHPSFEIFKKQAEQLWSDNKSKEFSNEALLELIQDIKNNL